MLDSAVRHAAILLVSTDERTLRIMTWLLLEAGYDVAKTTTADDAIGRKTSLTPAIIVIDGPLGREKELAAAALRRAFAGARLVGLHTHHETGAHIDAEGHLHKPFHADDLITLVRLLLTVQVGSKSEHVHA